MSRWTRFADEIEKGSDPDPTMQAVAHGYHQAHQGAFGLEPWEGGTLPYEEHDPDLGRQVAQFYHVAPHSPQDPEVRESYDAFKRETLAQWNHLKAQGYRMNPWTGQSEQPYANSAEMFHDVRKNRHLHFFTGGEMPADHPMMEPVHSEPGFNYNEVFRAVHDALGHAVEGYQFGPRGEYNAALAHAKLYSPTARKAMLPETFGQNSWVNYGPESHLPVTERPFPEQKVFHLPENLHPKQLRMVRRGMGRAVFTKAGPARPPTGEVRQDEGIYHGTRMRNPAGEDLIPRLFEQGLQKPARPEDRHYQEGTRLVSRQPGVYVSRNPHAAWNYAGVAAGVGNTKPMMALARVNPQDVMPDEDWAVPMLRTLRRNTDPRMLPEARRVLASRSNKYFHQAVLRQLAQAPDELLRKIIEIAHDPEDTLLGQHSTQANPAWHTKFPALSRLTEALPPEMLWNASGTNYNNPSVALPFSTSGVSPQDIAGVLAAPGGGPRISRQLPEAFQERYREGGDARAILEELARNPAELARVRPLTPEQQIYQRMFPEASYAQPDYGYQVHLNPNYQSRKSLDGSVWAWMVLFDPATFGKALRSRSLDTAVHEAHGTVAPEDLHAHRDRFGQMHGWVGPAGGVHPLREDLSHWDSARHVLDRAGIDPPMVVRDDQDEWTDAEQAMIAHGYTRFDVGKSGLSTQHGPEVRPAQRKTIQRLAALADNPGNHWWETLGPDGDAVNGGGSHDSWARAHGGSQTAVFRSVSPVKAKPKAVFRKADWPERRKQTWDDVERAGADKNSPYWDKVEMVPTEALVPYREQDRETSPKVQGDDTLDALTEDIRQRGILDAMVLQYSKHDRTATLGEGNTRLAAAQRLGISHVPVRVVRRTDPLKGHPVPGIEPDSTGYVPGELKPSEIGIPTAGHIRDFNKGLLKAAGGGFFIGPDGSEIPLEQGEYHQDYVARQLGYESGEHIDDDQFSNWMRQKNYIQGRPWGNRMVYGLPNASRGAFQRAQDHYRKNRIALAPSIEVRHRGFDESVNPQPNEDWHDHFKMLMEKSLGKGGYTRPGFWIRPDGSEIQLSKWEDHHDYVAQDLGLELDGHVSDEDFLGWMRKKNYIQGRPWGTDIVYVIPNTARSTFQRAQEHHRKMGGGMPPSVVFTHRGMDDHIQPQPGEDWHDHFKTKMGKSLGKGGYTGPGFWIWPNGSTTTLGEGEHHAEYVAQALDAGHAANLGDEDIEGWMKQQNAIQGRPWGDRMVYVLPNPSRGAFRRAQEHHRQFGGALSPTVTFTHLGQNETLHPQPGEDWHDHFRMKMGKSLAHLRPSRRKTRGAASKPPGTKLGQTGTEKLLKADDLKRTTLPAGTTLYHGTDAADEFTHPRSPAWFSHTPEEAAKWAGWGSLSRGPRRVISYRTRSPLETFDTEAEADWSRLAEHLTGDPEGNPWAMAGAMRAAGHGGWTAPGEVMLSGSPDLEPLGSQPVGEEVRPYGKAMTLRKAGEGQGGWYSILQEALRKLPEAQYQAVPPQEIAEVRKPARTELNRKTGETINIPEKVFPAYTRPAKPAWEQMRESLRKQGVTDEEIEWSGIQGYVDRMTRWSQDPQAAGAEWERAKQGGVSVPPAMGDPFEPVWHGFHKWLTGDKRYQPEAQQFVEWAREHYPGSFGARAPVTREQLGEQAKQNEFGLNEIWYGENPDAVDPVEEWRDGNIDGNPVKEMWVNGKRLGHVEADTEPTSGQTRYIARLPEHGAGEGRYAAGNFHDEGEMITAARRYDEESAMRSLSDNVTTYYPHLYPSQNVRQPKWDQWIERGKPLFTPGGENSRELLFQMPHRPLWDRSEKMGSWQEDPANTEDLLPDGSPRQRTWRINTPSGDAILNNDSGLWSLYLPQGGSVRSLGADRSFEEVLPMAENFIANDVRGVPKFQSTHWDEPNVLAHVRMKDFTSPEGEKVLLIDEAQSDWHREGRKHGWREDVERDNAGLLKQINDLENQYDAAYQKYGDKAPQLQAWADHDLLTRRVNDPVSTPEWLRDDYNAILEAYDQPATPEVLAVTGRIPSHWAQYARPGETVGQFLQRASSELHGSSKQISDIRNQQGDLFAKLQSAPPKGPYEGNWHEMVLRRMVQLAAKHGYDRVGWITGDQSRDRYHLMNFADEVRYFPEQERLVVQQAGNGDWHEFDDIPANKLGEHIGEDAAQQLLAEPINEDPLFSGNGYHRIYPRDLPVGGKSHIRLYDEMMPISANRFVRPFGSKVEQTHILSQPDHWTQPREENLPFDFNDDTEDEDEDLDLTQWGDEGQEDPTLAHVQQTGLLPTFGGQGLPGVQGQAQAQGHAAQQAIAAELHHYATHDPQAVLDNLHHFTTPDQVNQVIDALDEVPNNLWTPEHEQLSAEAWDRVSFLEQQADQNHEAALLNEETAQQQQAGVGNAHLPFAALPAAQGLEEGQVDLATTQPTFQDQNMALLAHQVANNPQLIVDNLHEFPSAQHRADLQNALERVTNDQWNSLHDQISQHAWGGPVHTQAQAALQAPAEAAQPIPTFEEVQNQPWTLDINTPEQATAAATHLTQMMSQGMPWTPHHLLMAETAQQVLNAPPQPQAQQAALPAAQAGATTEEEQATQASLNQFVADSPQFFIENIDRIQVPEQFERVRTALAALPADQWTLAHHQLSNHLSSAAATHQAHEAMLQSPEFQALSQNVANNPQLVLNSLQDFQDPGRLAQLNAALDRVDNEQWNYLHDQIHVFTQSQQAQHAQQQAALPAAQMPTFDEVANNPGAVHDRIEHYNHGQLNEVAGHLMRVRAQEMDWSDDHRALENELLGHPLVAHTIPSFEDVLTNPNGVYQQFPTFNNVQANAVAAHLDGMIDQGSPWYPFHNTLAESVAAHPAHQQGLQALQAQQQAQPAQPELPGVHIAHQPAQVDISSGRAVVIPHKVPIHSIKITPELKQHVLTQGVARFKSIHEVSFRFYKAGFLRPVIGKLGEKLGGKMGYGSEAPGQRYQPSLSQPHLGQGMTGPSVTPSQDLHPNQIMRHNPASTPGGLLHISYPGYQGSGQLRGVVEHPVWHPDYPDLQQFQLHVNGPEGSRTHRVWANRETIIPHANAGNVPVTTAAATPTAVPAQQGQREAELTRFLEGAQASGVDLGGRSVPTTPQAGIAPVVNQSQDLQSWLNENQWADLGAQVTTERHPLDFAGRLSDTLKRKRTDRQALEEENRRQRDDEFYAENRASLNKLQAEREAAEQAAVPSEATSPEPSATTQPEAGGMGAFNFPTREEMLEEQLGRFRDQIARFHPEKTPEEAEAEAQRRMKQARDAPPIGSSIVTYDDDGNPITSKSLGGAKKAVFRSFGKAAEDPVGNAGPFPDMGWVRQRLKRGIVPFHRQPLGAFVLGSVARGEHRPDSDLDIGVLIPPGRDGRTALQTSEDYHGRHMHDSWYPRWGGRKVDFQFFHEGDPELEGYDKIPLAERGFQKAVGPFFLKPDGTRIDLERMHNLWLHHHPEAFDQGSQHWIQGRTWGEAGPSGQSHSYRLPYESRKLFEVAQLHHLQNARSGEPVEVGVMDPDEDRYHYVNPKDGEDWHKVYRQSRIWHRKAVFIRKAEEPEHPWHTWLKSEYGEGTPDEVFAETMTPGGIYTGFVSPHGISGNIYDHDHEEVASWMPGLKPHRGSEGAMSRLMQEGFVRFFAGQGHERPVLAVEAGDLHPQALRHVQRLARAFHGVGDFEWDLRNFKEGGADFEREHGDNFRSFIGHPKVQAALRGGTFGKSSSFRFRKATKHPVARATPEQVQLLSEVLMHHYPPQSEWEVKRGRGADPVLMGEKKPYAGFLLPDGRFTGPIRENDLLRPDPTDKWGGAHSPILRAAAVKAGIRDPVFQANPVAAGNALGFFRVLVGSQGVRAPYAGVQISPALNRDHWNSIRDLHEAHQDKDFNWEYFDPELRYPTDQGLDFRSLRDHAAVKQLAQRPSRYIVGNLPPLPET